jgi:hypothetical protein
MNVFKANEHHLPSFAVFWLPDSFDEESVEFIYLIVPILNYKATDTHGENQKHKEEESHLSNFVSMINLK